MLSTTEVLDVVRAVGEETRLRIVHLLRHAELTVTDLTEILGQSQPRVSRHVKLLVDAGVVERSREGAWVFVRLAGQRAVTELVGSVLDAVDPSDPMLAVDVERLAVVRSQRSDAARAYFERIAPIWDEERSLHAPAVAVEAAVLELVGPERLGSICDLGTGTGRMLALLAERADRAVGLDSSHAMLRVARANLLDRADRIDAEAVRRIEFRQGDVYSPPFERDGFDLVVVHQVLHYLDDPARALHEAARLVAPGGRLLVVDFAPHQHDFLRTEHAHRRLGFARQQLTDWLDAAGLDCVTSRDLAPPDGTDGLTVSLWLGVDRRPARTVAADPAA